LTSFCVGIALASPFDKSVPELDASMPSESEQLGEMFDLVESGLSREHEGRILMLTVTKTFFASSTTSVTATQTTAAACYTASTTIPDCSTYVPEVPTTTPTTEATTTSTRRRKHNKHNKHNKQKKNKKKTHSTQKQRFHDLVNPYPDAVVTRRDGLPADIWDLLTPAPVVVDEESLVDLDTFDGVLDETESLSSGNLNWREVMVEGLSSCGRSGKRPRLLNVSKTTSTKTITMTSTVFASAATTATFDLDISCTSSGFTFGVSMC